MSVLILGEHDGRQLKIGTRQVVTAINAAAKPGEGVDLLLIGHGLANVADSARTLNGVSRVLVADAAHLADPIAEDVSAVVIDRVNASDAEGDRYSMIVAAHSAFSRNALPRAAALLDVGMLSDVLELLGDNAYNRPIYAGNLVATVRSDEGIQVLTLRGSRFSPAIPVTGDAATQTAPTVNVDVPPAFTRARKVRSCKSEAEGPELGTARVVVSGGRSLGSAEQFESVLSPLANTLNAALGATRAAVDAGYAPNELQVGQTGTIVAPDLYIAVGVSGAMQHTAGMKDSKVIVAINQDPDAPIFEVADYGLVADLFEAVPALTAALQKVQ